HISRGSLLRLLAAGKVAAGASLLPACSQLLFLRALESEVSRAALSSFELRFFECSRHSQSATPGAPETSPYLGVLVKLGAPFTFKLLNFFNPAPTYLPKKVCLARFPSF